jgi:hypothetical protein
MPELEQGDLNEFYNSLYPKSMVPWQNPCMEVIEGSLADSPLKTYQSDGSNREQRFTRIPNTPRREQCLWITHTLVGLV